MSKLIKAWRIYWRMKECVRLAEKILINSHAAIPTYTENTLTGQKSIDGFRVLPSQAVNVAHEFLRVKYGDVNDPDFDMNYLPKTRYEIECERLR